MKTVVLNLDVGGGVRLLSVTKDSTTSKTAKLVLSVNGNQQYATIDLVARQVLSGFGLTTTQLLVIVTAINQNFK
jgi:hypothetical protein